MGSVMVSRSSLITKNMQLKDLQVAVRAVFAAMLLFCVYREAGVFTAASFTLVFISLEVIVLRLGL